MSKTFLEINREIAVLQAQAAIAKTKEVGDVIRRMKEAIAVYGITARDLGLDISSPHLAPALQALQPEPPNKRGRKVGFRMSAKVKALPATLKTPKFQDGKGGMWAGVGNRPDWLKKALLAGKSLNDFRVGAASTPVKTFQAAPLVSAQAANTIKFMKIPQDIKPAKSLKIPKSLKVLKPVKPVKVKTPVKKIKALKVPAPEAARTVDAVVAPKVGKAVRIPKAKPASPSPADVAVQIASATQSNKGITISKAAQVPESPPKPKNLLKLPKSPLGRKPRSSQLAKSVNIDMTNGPGSGAAKIIKTPVKAEFMDPDSGKTWSGRGGRPDWFSKLITSGKTYEELRVKQTAQTYSAY